MWQGHRRAIPGKKRIHLSIKYLCSQKRRCIKITSADDSRVRIEVLVDMGSPVNLIKESIIAKYYKDRKLFKVKENLNLRGINDSMINIKGKLYEQIILDEIPEEIFDIKLLVVSDGTMEYDMLLGREFFNESNLKLTYINEVFNFEKLSAKSPNYESILPINAVEKRNKYDTIIENLDSKIEYRAKKTNY